MTNFIKLSVGFILVVSTFLLFEKKEPELPMQEYKQIKKTIPSKENKSQPKESTVNLSKQTVKPKYEFSELELDLLFEGLSGQEYSSDPMVELFSLAIELQNCKKAQRRIREIHSIVKQHIEFEDKVKNHCRSRFDEHSDLVSLMKSNKLKRLVMDNILNSPYSEILSKIDSRKIDAMTNKRFIDMFIKSNNAQMLVALTDLPYSIKDDYLIDIVSESINSSYPEYLEMITKQSLMIYSCQFNNGITCLPTSFFMVDKCIQDNNLCGKNLMHWYEVYLTKGHKTDLKRAIESLNNVSNQ